MNDRLTHVRLMMQRILGFLFVAIGVFSCWIVYTPGNPEDMSGGILVVIFGVFLITSKKYLFWDGGDR